MHRWLLDGCVSVLCYFSFFVYDFHVLAFSLVVYVCTGRHDLLDTFGSCHGVPGAVGIHRQTTCTWIRNGWWFIHQFLFVAWVGIRLVKLKLNLNACGNILHVYHFNVKSDYFCSVMCRHLGELHDLHHLLGAVGRRVYCLLS